MSAFPSGMDRLEQFLTEQGELPNPNKKLLREVAYERLHLAIRTVRPQPGDVLSEPRLCQALGISRTPVREALHVLKQDGILEVIPGRTIRIASPSPNKIANILQIREMLEPNMMSILARQMSDAQIDTISEITRKMEIAAGAGNRPEWSTEDDKWHALMSEYCPNQLLGETVLKIRNRIFIVSNDENVSDQYLIEGTAEHRDLVEAIRNRDEALAKQIWLDHLDNLRSDIIQRLRSFGF